MALDLVDEKDVISRKRDKISFNHYSIEDLANHLDIDTENLRRALSSDLKDDNEWKTIHHDLMEGELVDGLFLWHDECKPFLPMVLKRYIMSARCRDAPKSNGINKAKCIKCQECVWIVDSLKDRNFEGIICEKCVKEDQPKIVVIDINDKNFAFKHKIGITNRDVYRSYVAKYFIGKSRDKRQGKYNLKIGDTILFHFHLKIPGLILFEPPKNLIKEAINKVEIGTKPTEIISTEIVKQLKPKVEIAELKKESIESENIGSIVKPVKADIEQTKLIKFDEQVEKLVSFINTIKNKGNVYMDEASTKQTVILKIYHLLGWEIFNIDEVIPEYDVGGNKVDYLLKAEMRYKVFIEVKKLGEELDKYQDQLSLYNSKEGVDLCILTNGTIWWFYLPREKGKWEEKRFYTIDILRQDAEDIAHKFFDLLSKHNISNGNAIAKANKLYAGKQRDTEINKGFPIALKKMLEGDNEKFLLLLADETESICGYRPEQEQAKKLLIKHRNRI